MGGKGKHAAVTEYTEIFCFWRPVSEQHGIASQDSSKIQN